MPQSLSAGSGAVYRYNGNIYESVPDLGNVSPGEGLWDGGQPGRAILVFSGLPLENYTEPASAGVEYDWQLFGGDCVLW